jgi:hypothetical protein
VVDADPRRARLLRRLTLQPCDEIDRGFPRARRIRPQGIVPHGRAGEGFERARLFAHAADSHRPEILGVPDEIRPGLLEQDWNRAQSSAYVRKVGSG